MSWFNEGFSSLKGQISNLTKEIVVPNLLSDNSQGETDEGESKTNLEQLEDKCRSLEQEVEKLKLENSQLRQLEGSLQSSLSSPEVATLDCEVPDDDFDDSFQAIGWGDDVWTDSFLGQEGEEVGEKKVKDIKPEDEIANLQKQVNKLLLDKRKLKQRCVNLDLQVELLSEQLGRAAKFEENKSKQCQSIQTSEDFTNCITSTDFARMQQDLALVREERGQLRSELSSMTQVVRDLESQVRVSQDENANLSTGLNELDIQHQEAIEQMMIVKDATQKRYEALLVEFDELKSRSKELQNINETLNNARKKTSNIETGVQTENVVLTSDIEEVIRSNFQESLICKIKKIVPSNISDQLSEKTDSENPILTLISILNEGYKNILIEKNKCDLKIRDLTTSLQDVEDEINGLERENISAKETIDRLTQQCETLRPIPENDEELEVLDNKISALEKEVYILREVRSNLEVELISARTTVSDLTQHLQSNEAMIKNQDNLQNEFAILQASEQSLREELNNLIKVKECVVKENSDLKQKVADWEELQEKLFELQERFKDLENESSKSGCLVQELESSQEEINILKEEMLSLNEICNEKEKRFNELDSVYNANCKKIKTLESKCMKLDELIASMKIENESKDRKMCELILEKSTSDKKLEELKQINVDISSCVKELEKSCNMKDTDIIGLKNQLEDVREKYGNDFKNVNEVSNENCNMKIEIENLNAELKKKSYEIYVLKQSSKHVEENYSALENIRSEKDNECETLHKKISELKMFIEELKTSLKCVEQDKITALEKNVELQLTQKSLENTVNDLSNKLVSLEKEKLSDFKKIILDKDSEIASLKNKCSALEACVKQLEEDLKSVELDNQQQKSSAIETACSEMEQRLNISELENQSLSEKLKDVLSELNDKSNCLQKLNDQLKYTEELKTDLEIKCQKLEQAQEAMIKDGEIFGRSKEKHEMALESVSRLSQSIADLEKDNEGLKNLNLTLQENLDQQLPKLLDERDQLIKSLQAKHIEGLEYHNEIQRLNKLLSEELDKNSKLTSDISVINNNCLGLRLQIEEKEETVRLQDREVINLKQQVETLQNQLEYASQLLRVADRQEAEGQPSTDSSNMVSTAKPELDKEYIDSLERERNELAENLRKEQTRNKYLQNEVQEHYEKELSLAKEVERLRSHLVVVEDNYTQEMVRAEEQVKELQQRLSLADERVKNSSTAYTSASIRANQQVESLQAQARLLLEQRDKIQSQLSASEDKIQKQAAALTNLQIVLEQFQKDKEKDIALETERIKQNLQQAYQRNETLKDEVKSLQAQLREAKEGLNAAGRLSEQIERKDQAISDLKTEVKELNDKLQKMEEKIKATSTGVEGKVDRYLVKNLLVGYLSAPQQSRIQALRVLATVVDLSHEERQKVGLEPASNSDTLQQQSLSEAFVRFLENESRPQHPLRLPLAEAKESKSRRPSTSVLLPDVLPNMPQFTSGRNSGSILKDVLKDDRL